MRDVSFIRGIFGICETCTTELNLETDVARVAKFGYGYMYRSRCPSCSATNETVVDRDTHVSGVAWLRQVVANKDASHTIFEPVNELEEELLAFSDFLETASEDTIWAELHASS